MPERLLYLMGLSSAGYLGGKMARKAGPVINEIAVNPPDSDAAIAKAATSVATELPDLVQPAVDAQAQLSSFKAVTNANARAAIDALSSAVKVSGAAHTASELDRLIADLAKFRQAAETAAAATAADFANKKATQEEAETAQKAAAALQDFSAGVTQAIALAAASPMLAATTPSLIPRTIEVRGTNLSAEAILEIDQADLPFRMLLNKDGQNAPDVPIREDAAPAFARVLRLSIDPARLGSADLEQFQKWFGADGHRTFTLTNPDGQKAVLGFDLPPGVSQKTGPAT